MWDARLCRAQVPNVFRNEYTLIDINDEGFVSAWVTQGGCDLANQACTRERGRGAASHDQTNLTRTTSISHAQVSLMDEGGSTRDDLRLPTGTDELEKLAVQLKADFSEGKEIIVSVLKVCEEASDACTTTRAGGARGVLAPPHHRGAAPNGGVQAMGDEMINSMKIVSAGPK